MFKSKSDSIMILGTIITMVLIGISVTTNTLMLPMVFKPLFVQCLVQSVFMYCLGHLIALCLLIVIDVFKENFRK